MLKSLLQIALRNFTKRKGYSLLNVLGLTIGITCCLLIFEYVAYERSYDNYNKDAAHIFRVQEHDYQSGRLESSRATTSPAVGPALKKDFPEIGRAVIDVLDLRMIKGSPATALTGPSKAIISETTARKYFGNEDPIGWWTFAIAGVLAPSIALLTVGLQAFKATLANPVKSLRTE